MRNQIFITAATIGVTIVNYKLTLTRGTWYLSLQGSNHVLLQLLTFGNPQKWGHGREQKWGFLCCGEWWGDWQNRSSYRYFQKPILWAQFLYLPISGGGNGNPFQYSPVYSGESDGQRSLVGYSPLGLQSRHNWVTNTMSRKALTSFMVKIVPHD